MRPLYVEALGAVTAVGLNAPQTMSSLRVGYDRFEESALLGTDGEPVVAAAVPFEEGVVGLDRDMALLGLALRECSAGAPLVPIPLLVVLPEEGEGGASFPKLLDCVEDVTQVKVDISASRGFSFGRAGVAHALHQAEALIASQRADACYIAGVDSLLHRKRFQRLRDGGRLRGPQASDGIIPGEAGACIRVSYRASPTALAQVAGLGITKASGTPGRAAAVTAQVDAARAALAGARVPMSKVAFLASDVTGERAYMQERSLALARLQPKRDAALRDWSPALSVGDTGAAAGVLGLAYLSVRLAAGLDRGASLWMGASDGGARASVALLPIRRPGGERGRLPWQEVANG